MDRPDQPLSFSKENKWDLILELGNKAPNENNSIVVLEMDNPIEVDSARLLEANKSSRLLFFDAILNGRKSDDLRYGDGKANRFYVSNWNDMEQWFSWKVRVNNPVEYDLILNYYRDSISGTVALGLDGKTIIKNINPDIYVTDRNIPCAKVKIGTLELLPGEHIITFKPESQPAGELMKPLEILLKPVYADKK
jgi:hypothetical protein